VAQQDTTAGLQDLGRLEGWLSVSGGSSTSLRQPKFLSKDTETGLG